MSQPTKRKTTASKPRARRNSARLFADGSKKASSAQKAEKKIGKKRGTQSSRSTASSSLGQQSVLWTKSSPKKSGGKDSSLLIRIIRGIGNFFLVVFRAIFKVFKALFFALATVASRSKLALGVIVLCLVLLVGGLVDLGVNWGKIYSGVKVGEIDLSGKTAEEAEELIEATYGPRLSSTEIYIFANEEASHDLEAALAQTNDEAFAEQHSPEEVQARKLVWETNATSLGATLDTNGLVEQAIAFGRENGGVFDRILALFSGHTISPRAHYDDNSLESLASDIDATIGDPRVNYDIEVIEGHAVVVEGHDGDMINRDTFAQELNAALLESDEKSVSIIAQTEYTPLQITLEMAQETCDEVNAAIEHGAQFVYNGIGWNANAIELGNWIKTRIIKQDETWILQPYLDYGLAKGSLQNHLKASFAEAEVKIRFSNKDGVISVHSDTQGVIPRTKEALDSLSKILFGGESAPTSQTVITVESSSIPESLEIQEALDLGVISVISEFTTEYTANVTNRNHNIHLAADLLNKSIVAADGGIWSFNDTAGYCNEEAGFKDAGAIVNGEYVDEIGGGICQVATTVINAEYNSGLPVLTRHNHSLYISSYPAGLDAAVSYPDLDLRWQNDTASDVLVITSYTESTLTVALYGVDPGYQVNTETGPWEEGKKHETKTTIDETLTPGTSRVESAGVDGSRITVVRTVTDINGNVVRTDTFVSNYDPKTEHVIEGPKVPEEKPEEKTEDPQAGETEAG